MPNKKFKRSLQLTLRIAMMLIIAGIIVLLFPKTNKFQYDFQKGMPWRYQTLASPFDFPVYKTESELNEDREKISSEQVPIFNRNPNVKPYQVEKFESAIAILKNSGHTREMAKLSKVLSDIYNNGIVRLPKSLQADKTSTIKILENNIGKDTDFKTVYTPQSAYVTLSQAVDGLPIPQSIKESIFSLNLSNFLQPNLEYDAAKTNLELVNQIENISLTHGMVKTGEVIITKGESVTGEKIKILNSLKKEYNYNQGVSRNHIKIIAGQTALTLISLMTFSIFIYASRKRLFYNLKDFIFLYGMFLLTVVAGSISYHQDINILVIPVLFFTIIVNILFDRRLAIYLLLSTTLIVSYFAPNSYMYIFMQLTGGIVAIFSLSHLQRRGQLFLSIFFIFLTYAAIYMSFTITQEGDLLFIRTIIPLIWLAINCLLLSLTYPVIYLFERIFGYTTEISLMELSNPNHPVLRILTKKAPGTFQHSLMVANLSEEAIYRIGGNPLLTRTGALYHDIGKTYNPILFIENQSGGANPHDQFDFDESAQHIIAHVADGVEMAYKYNLPESIINFIRTHHGRSKVKYFYNSFKNKYPDVPIDETLFTYNGPDPISKECTVVMMADAVEAVSRTLAVKDEENITRIVNEIIDNQVSDGRFVNSDITFKEIAIVKRIFIEILTTIYHSRIAYPKLEKKEEKKHPETHE